MSTVLVDTSYLLALELANDQNHKAAIQHWNNLTDKLPNMVITSFIFDEVVTFLNSRGYHAKAVQVGNSLLHSPSIQFFHVDAALLLRAWSLLQQHQDKDYSLPDCISFAVMREMGISTAFTFDRHFIQAGFRGEP